MGEVEETDVLIVGGGPVGTMLSALLSKKFDVPNIVLEKEADIPPDPRAFSLNEVGIRQLQYIGLYHRVFTEIGWPTTTIKFLSSRQCDINQTPFLTLKFVGSGLTGHSRNVMFSQPIMEGHMQDVVKCAPTGEYRDRSEVVAIQETVDSTEVLYTRDGQEKRIRAKFVVGTDGKTGFVRKKYLEPKGVLMERAHPFEIKFVGLNFDITAPTPETHPNFPLWRLGYTPEDVLDAFIPGHFCYICNPDRRGVFSRAGPWKGGQRLWRAEFEVLSHEDPNELEKPANIWKIVEPYMTHKGRYYGISEDVTFPKDCMKTRRTWHYKFESRACNKWSVGRVLLAGDAAHVFPPYGGQGVTSGFQDAFGLSWRLAVALSPVNKSKTPAELSGLINGWERERKSHIKQALDWTMKLGDIQNEANPLKIFVRDWVLWSAQQIPVIRNKIQNQAPTVPYYDFEKGMAFLPDMEGGKTFSQIYCCRLDESKVRFTDDVIYSSQKKSLFQTVVLADSVEEANSLHAVLNKFEAGSQEARLVLEEATYLVQDTKAILLESKPWNEQLIRPATAGEFMESPLIRGRPEPTGYNPHIFKSQHPGKKFVIIRPDTITFAVCKDTVELSVAFAAMTRVLNCRSA